MRSALDLLSMRLACPLRVTPSSRTATMIRSPLGPFGRRFTALIRFLTARAGSYRCGQTSAYQRKRQRSSLSLKDEAATSLLRKAAYAARRSFGLDLVYWNVVSMRADASK